jgi:hypothetical protein
MPQVTFFLLLYGNKLAPTAADRSAIAVGERVKLAAFIETLIVSMWDSELDAAIGSVTALLRRLSRKAVQVWLGVDPALPSICFVEDIYSCKAANPNEFHRAQSTHPSGHEPSKGVLFACELIKKGVLKRIMM